MLENIVIRKIFGPKGDKVTGEYGDCKMKKYYDVYSSSLVIRMIRSKIMRFVSHIGRVEK
jgi:hypothetical protein